MESKYPYIDPKLIEYLEKLHPDVCPTQMLDAWTLGHKAGAIHLIKHLKRLLESQVKDSMKGITA